MERPNSAIFDVEIRGSLVFTIGVFRKAM